MNIISIYAQLTAPHQLVFSTETLAISNLDNVSFVAETLVTAVSPGTELAAWHGLPPLRSGAAYPRFMGYCNVARVIYVGDQCRRVREGDLVLTFSSHRSHFICKESEILAVIDDNVDPCIAVKSYLFHLGYSAVLNVGLPVGANVAVIGLGVLGVSSVVLSQLSGWSVSAITSHKPLVDFSTFSPDVSLFTRESPPQHQSVQAVILTTNSWHDWDLALKLCTQRGKIVVLGFPGRGESSVPFNPLRASDFYQKQLLISAAGMCPESSDSRGFTPFNEISNIHRILAWFASGKLNPDLLVADSYPYQELPNVYNMLSSPHRSVHTCLLNWKNVNL